METPSDDPTLPPGLRWLKGLVIVLTVVMIVGFALLITTLIVKLNAAPVPLPDRLSLPDGAQAAAYTQGDGWAAVVTQDGRILVYDLNTNALRQEIEITP